MAGAKNDGKKDEKKSQGKNPDEPTNGGDNEDPILKSIFQKMDILTNEANQRAASTDLILQNISDIFDKFTEGISVVKEEVGQLRHSVISERRENKRQNVKIDELESKLEFIERDTRRSNIVLEGVPEDKDQSLIAILSSY